MFRRTVLRFVNAVRGRPFTSMVVMALLGATVAATAIAASEQAGGPITAVKVVREAQTGFSATSTSYVDVPGATTNVTVSAGQRALILARFSAFSACFASASNVCSGYLRILIGGVEGAPETGSVWDNTPIGEQDRRGIRTMERSRGGFGGLPPGTYEVKVQARVDSTDTLMNLQDWHLTVERSQTG
jgi:hypothetical protein